MKGVYGVKTAVITGSSRGIGAAAARLFARRGYCVVLNWLRSETQAMELLTELRAEGCSAIAVGADVSTEAGAEALITAALEAFGQIDVLVNNAGLAHFGLFTDADRRDLDAVFSANVGSVFGCTRAVLPHMIHRKCGSIVNVSSMWGQTGASCEVLYSAAKAAVIGMTRALAKELGPSGIRVNCVAPGLIDTDMNAHLTPEDVAAVTDETPLCRMGTAEEAAEAILFLAEPTSAFITGQVLGVNGGLVI